jgi:CDP-diacylglycerol--serine O-phosphatidyltransferase
MFSDIIFLSIISVLMPILLVIKMPLFSFKLSKTEKRISRLNVFRITLILSTAILFFIFQFAAIPFIVILYLTLSLINNLTKI